ncbi:T9SS sorting signal type C domain-containing protein [Flavobacterium plurextorum]|uniref:T9SS sorting signal type C domain-containing protein n=1 Tax=Flavobacterium TaxID=237 RepID=UPI00214DEE32|nr:MULTISPECIES: T9SS sorting signal type C domain-containing protein [Flavobacterium]UUW09933.1 T9SS sorting signal type C domain-containing protein [Flavobacterium plurextorum]
MIRTLLFFLLLPFFGFSQALSGDYFISNSNPNDKFKTLESAITEITKKGLSKPVTFQLEENQLLSTPLVIKSLSGSSATNTLTIKPKEGANIRISGNFSKNGVIVLDGADNIIIDGNNGHTDNSLKIYNTFDINDSYNARMGIWLYNGADNNKIQNLTIQLNILGPKIGTYSTGVLAGSSNVEGNGNNSSNTISNVTFTDVKQAVIVNGQNQSNTNWTIEKNKIGSTDNDTKPFLGIYMQNVNIFTISNNIIKGVRLPGSYGGKSLNSGIFLENSNSGVLTKNLVSEIENGAGNGLGYGICVVGNNNLINENTISSLTSSFNGSYGIKSEGNQTTIYGNRITSVFATSGTTAAGIHFSGNDQLVYNNFVNDVKSNGGGNASSQDGFGIYINSGSNIKLYHNSVKLTSNQNSGSSAALYIKDGSGLDIRNNIFANMQTSGSMRFAIFSEVSNRNNFTYLDYNDYYSTQFLGCFGSYYTSSNRKLDLDKWKEVTLKDGASKSFAPIFANTTDLYLAKNNSDNENLSGKILSEVPTDIDGTKRVKPYMGAHEIESCIPEGDQTKFGTDSWIGYVYTYTSENAPNPSTPTTLPISSDAAYIGTVTEPKLFDRNVGSNQITGLTTNIKCITPPSDLFFVRYKMQTTIPAGKYNFTIGGDDGVRLYIDNKLIDLGPVVSWGDHSYSLYAAQISLDGKPHSFVLEYYEKKGDARVSFSYGEIKGDAALPYGIDKWNVYGFTVPDISLPASAYAGSYVDNHLDINTQLLWNADQSPSSYSGWQGAAIADNNFTITYKRQGFPCGRYQIELVNCDDVGRIYLDDNQIFEQKSHTTTSAIINKGEIYELNKDSRIEIRLLEDAGNANIAVKFIEIPTIYDGTGTPPTKNTAITIAANMTLKTDLEVCSCTINSEVTLTVPSDRTLTVNENITVASKGKLLIENGGSLMQSNTSKTSYSGDFKSFELQRNTTPVYRYDITFWSSPVTEASAFTLHNLSPDTLGDKYTSYDPFSGWVIHPYGAKVMIPGRGYNVRAPQTYDVTITNKKVYTASFVGIPNNGDIPFTPTADHWNLIGNPYPSSISADELMSTYDHIGPLYFWTHGLPPSKTNNPNDVSSYYSSDDYAVYTGTGGTVTDPKGTNNGNIAAGQGFFIYPNAATKIVFNNDMRLGGKNTAFFKKAQTAKTEKSRLWLNCSNAGGAFKQTLIGYVEGATNNWDFNYDASTLDENAYLDFYSIVDTDLMAIQGRALPFDKNDLISLGYKATIGGEFTISIDHVDGLFDNQVVYLEDKTTDVIHDLSAANYTFSTAAGTFDKRFVLRFTGKTLGTGDFENIEDGLLVAVKDKSIKLVTSKESIKEVSIYDISGKLLYQKKKVGSTEHTVSNLQSGNQILLVKTILENDFSTTRKIIYR